MQVFPPYCGGGFVQVLVNFFTPHPHVVLQLCASQFVWPPSIAKYIQNKNCQEKLHLM